MPGLNLHFKFASVSLAAAGLAAAVVLLAASSAQAQPRGYDHRRGPVVRCESDDGHYRECRVPFRDRAMLVQQISSSRCIRGRTYGFKSGRVWVSGGCRADFGPR